MLPDFLVKSLLFGVGSWSVYFAGQFIPVALVARIPEQYANVIRDDVYAVAFEGITSVLSDNLEKALYGFAIAFALCTFLNRKLRKPSLILLIGVMPLVICKFVCTRAPCSAIPNTTSTPGLSCCSGRQRCSS